MNIAEKKLPPAVRLTDKEFESFSAYVTDHLGIRMPANKRGMLQSRLDRRLRKLNLGVKEYQDLIFGSTPEGNKERVNFYDVVTTNKTDFFREERHFDYLSRSVLPKLQSNSPKGSSFQYRHWCAGCSTGEEAYTTAMVLSEFGQRNSSFDWSLLATDISTRVLRSAQAGVYPNTIIHPVPNDLKKKYMLRGRGKYSGEIRFVPSIRKKLRFARLNFMNQDYGIKTMFDVIFFRNVMIYFDNETKEKVINKLCQNLRPNGFLFVGHTESIINLNVPVEQVSTAVFQKIK